VHNVMCQLSLECVRGLAGLVPFFGLELSLVTQRCVAPQLSDRGKRMSADSIEGTSMVMHRTFF
jgi:hypothetical protein